MIRQQRDWAVRENGFRAALGGEPGCEGKGEDEVVVRGGPGLAEHGEHFRGVLAVGLSGPDRRGLESREMALAQFAVAPALAAAWVITQVLTRGIPAGPVWNIGVMHGGFVLLFAGAGLLFRRSYSEGSSQSEAQGGPARFDLCRVRRRWLGRVGRLRGRSR